MTVTRENLQDFTRFADERLAQGEVWSFQDLVREWEAARHHAESVAALNDSHADAEAGRTKPVCAAFADIRKRLGHPG